MEVGSNTGKTVGGVGLGGVIAQGLVTHVFELTQKNAAIIYSLGISGNEPIEVNNAFFMSLLILVAVIIAIARDLKLETPADNPA